MWYESYALRLLLTILVLVVGLIWIGFIIATAPNFWVGLVYIIPFVPLIRIVSDIVNPEVNLPLIPRVLLRTYVQLLFWLGVSLGAIVGGMPLMALGLAMLGALLAVFLGAVGLLLWVLQYGLGIQAARDFDPNEWLGALLVMSGGLLVLGVGYAIFTLGSHIWKHMEQPLVDGLHALWRKISAM